MKLKIDLKESSSPLEFTDVKNSYTKGPLFCIYSGNTVTKIPIQNIWRIVEDYVSANTNEIKEVWDKVTDKPATTMKRFGQKPTAEEFWEDMTRHLGGPTSASFTHPLVSPTQSEDAIEELCGFVDWELISEEPLTENFIREFQDYVVWDYVSGNSTLSEDFIREFQDKVDWNVVSMDQVLSEPFIREFQDRVDWMWISELQALSEDFIREFKDSVNWKWISFYQTLSEDFIREFQNEVDWKTISKYQTLSENFIREFQDRVDWVCIFPYQGLSEEFKKEFEDRI